MGTIILLVILGIATIAALITARNFGRTAKKLDKSDNDFDYGTAVWGKRISLSISGVLILIVGGIFAFGSFYSQGEGVSTVQVSFAGNVVTTTTDAGLKVKAPWNSIQEFNIRNQTVEMFSNAGGEGKDGAAISAPLDGGANASVSISITAYSATACGE